MTPLKKEVVMRRKRLVYFLVVTLFATSVWALNYWTPKSPTGSSVGLKIDTGQDALINGTLHITTAANWYINNIAYTGTMTLLNSVTDGSVLTTQHYHSALSASDGSPANNFALDAAGNIGFGKSTLQAWASPFIALELGDADNQSVLSAQTNSNSISVGANWFYDGATKRPVAGIASRLIIYGDDTLIPFKFDIADMGAAGSAVTFTTVAVLDTFGAMGIGDETPSGEADKLNVYSNVAASLPVAYIYQDNASATGPALKIKNDGSGGALQSDNSIFINETSNANSTIGLTINQGANDDQAQAWKSSDVAHPMTAVSEADTYGEVAKAEATSGGLKIVGFKDADGVAGKALYLYGNLGETPDNTHTTAGVGVVQIDAAKTNAGTSLTTVATDENILVVANAGTAELILSGDGHLYTNDVAAVYDYDDTGEKRDDVAMISTLDKLHAQVGDKRIVDSEWEDFTRYNEVDLIKTGILGGPITNVDPKNRGLLNMTGLIKLHNGAIRQLGRSVGETEYRVGSIEQRLAQLEMERLFYSPTIGGRN